VCLLPWPNSAFEAPAPERPTGRRVEVDAVAAGLEGIWPRLYRRSADGASPVGALVTVVEGEVDPATLPADPMGVETEAEAAVALFVADVEADDFGARVPVRVEARASPDGAQTLLLITPWVALRASTRHAVVVTSGLRAPGGAELPDSIALGEADASDLAPVTGDLVAVAAAAGFPRSQLKQVWDFTVRSPSDVVADLDSMVETAQPASAAALELQPVARAPGPNGAERFDFTFSSLRWRADRDAVIARDAEGRPTPVGLEPLRAILVLPASATPENPAQPILFGHGLSASAELMYTQLVPLLDLDAGPYALLLVDWDLHGSRGAGLPDILAISGALNATAFAHSLLQSASDERRARAALEALGGDGPEAARILSERVGAIGSTPATYLGQSLGSMIGILSHGAGDPPPAAVYNVGGGGLATILRTGEVTQRLGIRESIEATVAAEPVAGLAPALAVDVLLSVSQIALDLGDPTTHVAARRDLGQPLAHPHLIQMSIGDGIVPNVCTETLARTLGSTLLTPALRPVAGLAEVEAPVDGGALLSQFLTSDMGFQAHIALNVGPAQAQALEFLATGRATYDCGGGPCDLLP
jgi:pimeloyl-ACP methyl ester carboxylesterase